MNDLCSTGGVRGVRAHGSDKSAKVAAFHPGAFLSANRDARNMSLNETHFFD
jgi:hypothetical protein